MKIEQGTQLITNYMTIIVGPPNKRWHTCDGPSHTYSDPKPKKVSYRQSKEENKSRGTKRIDGIEYCVKCNILYIPNIQEVKLP